MPKTTVSSGSSNARADAVEAAETVPDLPVADEVAEVPEPVQAASAPKQAAKPAAPKTAESDGGDVDV